MLNKGVQIGVRLDFFYEILESKAINIVFTKIYAVQVCPVKVDFNIASQHPL